MSATVGLAVGISVACWLASGLRRVPGGHWLVATRGGRVQRVSGPGLAWRIPLLEEFHPVVSAAHEQPLVVRASTDDGARVLVLGEASVMLPRPEPGTPYTDPWREAERAAEQTIARTVASWTSVELASVAPTSQRTLRHAVSAAVDEYGVTLLELDLVQIDLQIDVRLDDLLDESATSRGSG